MLCNACGLYKKKKIILVVFLNLKKNLYNILKLNRKWKKVFETSIMQLIILFNYMWIFFYKLIFI